MLPTLTAPAVVRAAPSVSPLGVVDIDQVSELLGVSRTWVEKTLRSDPTFPRPFRLGARRHIKLSDLQMWVDQKARAA